jgi:gamma-glutamyl-gamma-aminobutyrate hydrolase PuuD
MKDGMGPFEVHFSRSYDLYKRDSLNGIDALILWGGEDISPSLYNEKPIADSGPTNPSKRDLFEIHLMREAVAKKIPIIGVCRGAQLACAFAGGKLIQDVKGHTTAHKVTSYDGHIMHSSSAHHQMMYPYDIKHELLAWSTSHQSEWYDPLGKDYCEKLNRRERLEPEVVYFPEIHTLGVQGHPEWMPANSTFVRWFNEQISLFLFTLECKNAC